MSTLINLLPDLRQAKLKELRRRQLATGVSITIWIVAGGVIALMVIFMAGQKVSIKTHTDNIVRDKAKLEAEPGLLEALTAEQHLASLPGLYNKRVYLTKFFQAYTDASPISTVINSLGVDAQNTLTVRGVAPTYAEVAKLARAMQASNITVGTGADSNNTPYFTDVNILSTDLADQVGVTFTITAIMGGGVTSGN